MDTPSPSELRSARDQFDALLARKTRESEWQTFFAQHPYVLSLSLPLRLDPRDIEPLGRPGKTEPDFLFYPRDTSPIPFYGVIELKRPDSPIVTVTRRNVALLTRGAETAIEQAKHYSDTLHRQLVTPPDQILLLGNSAHIFVIMGTSRDLIEKLGMELYYEQVQSKLPGNLQILPYDTLLSRFSAHVPPQVLLVAPKLVSEFEPELIRIPAGEFLMGSDPGKDNGARDNEQPQQTVYLPEYYIAKAPVTNGQFATFVEATGHRPPATWWGRKSPPGKEDHPVFFGDWSNAMAYCNWLAEMTGKTYRLPTEAEWEKAARGTDGRIYPWGNERPDNSRCSFNFNVGDTTPVGMYSPPGDSPYGCADMAGNVWEWCHSLYKPYPYDPKDGREDPKAGGTRVVRGSAFVSDQSSVRCAFRIWEEPNYSLLWIGFRLVVAPGF